jgi:hypothetical protein
MPPDTPVQDVATIIADEEEGVEHGEGKHWTPEEVDGGYRFAMIAQKASDRLVGSGLLPSTERNWLSIRRSPS